ncbi:MAG: hypothetical protein COZ43_13550 [Sphingomonadales bacterium CG_4_10_14_3_um_filter_58_15]|nr:MAG: hypothetical protein COZ43_13550 [Sphingomonadales bacterium CG_4_10_14_3_um_filter_58_15]
MPAKAGIHTNGALRKQSSLIENWFRPQPALGRQYQSILGILVMPAKAGIHTNDQMRKRSYSIQDRFRPQPALGRQC